MLAGSFLAGGIYFVVAMPEIYIGQIWIAASLVLIGVYLVSGRQAKREQRLRSEGLPGRATILGVEQTGVYINQQPRVKLRLRIEADGVQPFEVSETMIVPIVALGRLTDGRPLSVLVDRDDPGRFTVDWDAAL